KWSCSGCTHISSMINQPMAEVTALLRRNDLPESHFHFFRLLDPVYQPDPVYQTDTMGIRNNRRLSEHISHDQIGAFSSNNRQFQQSIEIIRYLSLILIPDDLHTGADVSGLALPQAAGPDDLLDLFHRSICQSLH